MKRQFLLAASLIAIVQCHAALAQETNASSGSGTAAPPTAAILDRDQQEATDAGTQAAGQTAGDIIVTATRRNERLQDVPISITAFSQAELTRKGIVGYEGLARETPGIVLNKASDNFNNFTARGITTNGYGANLQSTVAIYLDELPLSTVGNSTTLNPNLYDVERVEFLRGPQGTLFGSGSLSGALRILTKSPELTSFDSSALVDIGLTPDGGGVRQRYNGMVNLPLINDTLGLRIVGFYRDEEGYVDNLGTGIQNANTLVDWGGRAILLWKPTDRLSVRLLASYEDSDPEDSAMTTPSLGEFKRFSLRPDRYAARIQTYNGTVEYDLDFARITSSTTYSYNDADFDLDLAGTFGRAIPFFLDINGKYKTFVEEARLVSAPGGKLDYVFGGYYLHRELQLDSRQQSTPTFLATRGITGLPADGTFALLSSNSRSYELAGFGELTYHFDEKFWITAGLRYGKYGTSIDTNPGFNSSYFINALFGIPGQLTQVPTSAASVTYPSAAKASWKVSASFRPSSELTTYATVATGYRTPVFNARAGAVSVIDPTDLVIPAGARSDNLTSYELGVKGRWLGGALSANVAAYYIDWRNIQVQANRLSDSVQFATNVGSAVSKGVEFEIAVLPVRGLSLGVNGSFNDARIRTLTGPEAAISGAVDNARLASPHFQGAAFGTLT